MNAADYILAAGQDDAPAVFQSDTVLTYSALRREVRCLADELLACGHQTGECIGICSENSPFFVSAYLGIVNAGMVAVPLHTGISRETFENEVREAGVRTLYVSRRSHLRLRPWAEKLGVQLRVEGAANPIERVDPRSSVVPSPSPASKIPRLASLMFTSGSTGQPKGVMVTHRNIESNTRDIVEYMGLTPADRAMVVLPFHYCFGLSLLHSLLAAGGSIVLNNQFLYPQVVLDEMVSKACTGLAGVPSTYQILLRKSRFKEMCFPALRWFQQAGGKLHNPFIQEIRDAFPQVRYYLMYGQTEATARLSYLSPDRLNDKLGSIGMGLPSTRLEVRKPDGSLVNPGSDEVGEIIAFGPNVTPGYWNDPEETAKFFRDGGLHTGDLARVDAEGFIFLVERLREMIKSGGNRVSAKEVEDVIAELPEVVEVAVIGIPHIVLGEAIKAFVVATPGAALNVERVKVHCHRRLSDFKCPETIEFLPALPHNEAGKVMKGALKAGRDKF